MQICGNKWKKQRGVAGQRKAWYNTKPNVCFCYDAGKDILIESVRHNDRFGFGVESALRRRDGGDLADRRGAAGPPGCAAVGVL